MNLNLEPVFKYFWDCDTQSLSWSSHKDFIIRRLLVDGDFNAARWLRKTLGDEYLRDWIIAQGGHGLSPRQISYWALILDIDATLADEWEETASNSIWEKRR